MFIIISSIQQYTKHLFDTMENKPFLTPLKISIRLHIQFDFLDSIKKFDTRTNQFDLVLRNMTIETK